MKNNDINDLINMEYSGKKSHEELIGPELNLIDNVNTYRTKRKLKKKPKIKAILLLVLIVMAALIVVVKPKIYLNGDKHLKITYNKEYEELGAKAMYFGKDISNKIRISGTVDSKKIGKYNIKYAVTDSFLKASKTRVVEVIDDVKPKITLVGDKELSICPNAKYEELGYNAIDEYDGDLTDKVVIDEKEDSITYTVKDYSKNEVSVVRTLKREDIEKPEIKLNGSSSYSVILGGTYKEAGYTVTDNCSSDLNDKVKVTGTVDTNKEGTYNITYTVTDDNNNTETVTRKVVVQKNYPKRNADFSCGEPGVVYLTFDDGPNSYYTPTILDVLKKYGVKATFFVTNAGPDNLIKREYDEGHLVAIHSATHEYSQIYKSSEAFFNDIGIISNRIEKATGVKPKYLRFPGGSSNTVSRHYSTGIMSRLVNEVEEKGFSYFDWNVNSGDAGELDYSQSFDGQIKQEIRNVVSNLRKDRGNVVLMHDIKKTTASAIEGIIKGAQEKGFTKFDVLNSSITCHQRTNN